MDTLSLRNNFIAWKLRWRVVWISWNFLNKIKSNTKAMATRNNENSKFQIDHSIWEIKGEGRLQQFVRKIGVEQYEFMKSLAWRIICSIFLRENKSCSRRCASKYNGNRLEACHNFHSSVKTESRDGSRIRRVWTRRYDGGDRYERDECN